MSWYQKGKTNLDLLEQETVSGSSISWAICKSAPCPRQICIALSPISTLVYHHASTSPLSILQAKCPSCCPTNSIKALRATCCYLANWPALAFRFQDRSYSTLMSVLILHGSDEDSDIDGSIIDMGRLLLLQSITNSCNLESLNQHIEQSLSTFCTQYSGLNTQLHC